jgi:hypothetical protein
MRASGKLLGHSITRDLIRSEDITLSHTKEQGRSRFVLFDETLDKYSIDRLRLESELRQAGIDPARNSRSTPGPASGTSEPKSSRWLRRCSARATLVTSLSLLLLSGGLSPQQLRPDAGPGRRCAHTGRRGTLAL